MNVRVVQRQGDAAMVEWASGEDLRRAIVPAAEVSPAGDVAETVLEQGIPWGLSLETALMGGFRAVGPVAIIRALRQRGIWTAADVQKRSGEVFGAIQAAYGVDLQSVLVLAARLVKEGKDGG